MSYGESTSFVQEEKRSLVKTDAIQVENLARTYQAKMGFLGRQKRLVTALRNVSLQVAGGETFGLVGPNGAGKTSLIKILSTLLLPGSGTARVLGMDVARQEKQIRARINTVFGGDRGLYTRLSAEENMYYFSDLYHVPRHVAKQRVPKLLELVQLRGRERERVEGYSRGMMQRLHIAKSLVNDPDLLFLDEPTIGLDPRAARSVRAIIEQLHGEGKTILLTSHYMHEVDQLCDRVAVINKGEIAASGTPYHLKRYVAGIFIVEVHFVGSEVSDEWLADIRAAEGVEHIHVTTGEQHSHILVQTTLPEQTTAFLQQGLAALHNPVVLTREPTLEDAYMKLVGGDV